MRTGCAALIILILIGLALNRKPIRDAVVEWRLPSGGDHITLIDDRKAGPGYLGPETAILVDGRVDGGGTGCRNDYLAPEPAEFSNLRQNDCEFQDEILVLSVDDAIAVDSALPGAGFWTDATGEGHAVALGPPAVVPIKLWLVAAPEAVACTVTGSLDALGPLACDVLNLEYVYNLQRAGLQFSATIVDRSGDPAVLALLSCAQGATECECPSDAPTDPTLYDPAVMNVYVVSEIAGSHRGWWCNALPKGGVILLSVHRGAFTLAHELGHSFGLPHPDGSFAYASPAVESLETDQNLMFSAVKEDPRISLGQAVRMTLLPWSFVNYAELRPGQGSRACEENWSLGNAQWAAHALGASKDGVCPRISFP